MYYFHDCNSFTGVTISKTSHGEVYHSFNSWYFNMPDDYLRYTGYAGVEFNVEDFPNTYQITIQCRFIDIGAFGSGDYFRLISNKLISGNTHTLDVCFSSDGLYIKTGGSYIELGTNIVPEGSDWVTWVFRVNTTEKYVDVYKDSVLQGRASCDLSASWANQITMKQFKGSSIVEKYTTNIAYVEIISISQIQATIYELGQPAEDKEVIIIDDTDGSILWQGTTDENGQTESVVVMNENEHTVIAIDPDEIVPPVCAHRIVGVS